jgi:hypothetical protein
MAAVSPLVFETNDVPPDTWALSRIHVLDFMTTVLATLWISAAATEEEIADRIQGIRAAMEPAFDLLPNPDRSEASAFFAEKMDRIERSIAKARFSHTAAMQ